jgi:Zn-dependent protease with chaperone function
MSPIDSTTGSAGEPGRTSIYFDGTSSRRRAVTLVFGERLELHDLSAPVALWAYEDIRRADGPPGVLRITCTNAPALARLEIRDAAVAAELISRCARLDENAPGRRGVGAIVGWSLAAAVSIVAVVMFGVPLAADRLAPLVPPSFEQQIGDVAEKQVNAMFGGKVCTQAAGQAAFAKLVNTVSATAGLDSPVRTEVSSSPVPNAFALPGGKVYLFNGLLARAESPDEIAGVLAHEFGHLKHRDGMRNLIYNGGSSFLIGLLFGDVTGSGAVIFTSRALVTSSYSRDAESNADAFSIEVMHRLGRSPKAMGELLTRVTGKEVDKSLSILASHPMTEDRLKRMTEEDRPTSGLPLLTDEEWSALKAICNTPIDHSAVARSLTSVDRSLGKCKTLFPSGKGAIPGINCSDSGVDRPLTSVDGSLISGGRPATSGSGSVTTVDRSLTKCKALFPTGQGAIPGINCSN